MTGEDSVLRGKATVKCPLKLCAKSQLAQILALRWARYITLRCESFVVQPIESCIPGLDICCAWVRRWSVRRCQGWRERWRLAVCRDADGASCRWSFLSWKMIVSMVLETENCSLNLKMEMSMLQKTWTQSLESRGKVQCLLQHHLSSQVDLKQRRKYT